MFDTMTITKTIGALCGALLIFLIGNWAAGALYTAGDGGHGDEAHNAYIIETDEGGEEVEVAEEESGFAVLLAAADVEKGAKTFGKCKACHKLEEGKNGLGPSLYGVLDRDIGSESFKYSGVMTELEGNWTGEALDEFLTKPKDYAPGTKMTFSGLSKPEDRANVIAYLATIGG